MLTCYVDSTKTPDKLWETLRFFTETRPLFPCINFLGGGITLDVQFPIAEGNAQ